MQPHILLVTTDQQRYDALGINGNKVLETPNLDAHADAGVNFSRCYTTCPVCIPARRTLITGLHPESHGLRHYQDGLEFNPPTTLPAELSRAGYQTQLVGKMHLHPQGKRFGFDNIILSESSNWRPGSNVQKRNDYVRWLRQNGVQGHPSSHGISGNGRLVVPWSLEDCYHHNCWLRDEAIRFLTEDRDPTAPFFLHLSFVCPHPPLVPPRDYLERYLRKDVGEPAMGSWAPEDTGEYAPLPPDAACGPFDLVIMKRARAAYYALINHIDDCIAHVMERWFEYGTERHKQPMWMLYSSDHGEMLGDHQLFRKSLGYEGSAHIPFFARGWNVPVARGKCDELVSWEDITPTILDLAGLDIPDHMDGRSLAPILRGEEDNAPEREYIFGQCSGYHHNLWLATKKWKYLWFPKTNEEQLFDLENDPKELTDLSGKGELIDPLRRLMRDVIAHRDDLDYDPAKLNPCAGGTPKLLWPRLA